MAASVFFYLGASELLTSQGARIFLQILDFRLRVSRANPADELFRHRHS
jgi:hypothetical protein